MDASVWSWVMSFFQALVLSLFWIIVPKDGALNYSHWRTFLMFTIFQLFPMPIWIHIHAMYWIKAPLITLLLLLCTLWALRCCWKEKLLLFAIYQLFIMLCEVIGMLIVMLVLHGRLELATELDIPVLLGQTIWSVIFLSVISIFSVFWKKFDRTLCIRVTVLFVLLPISQILLLLGLYRYNLEHLTQSMEYYTLISSLITGAADLMVYLTITNAAKDLQIRMELEQLRIQRETDYKYYQQVQHSAEEISKLRHDFKNQLQVAYAAFCADSTDEARQLLDELNRQTSAVQEVSCCPDPIVNAALTVKVQQVADTAH